MIKLTPYEAAALEYRRKELEPLVIDMLDERKIPRQQVIYEYQSLTKILKGGHIKIEKWQTPKSKMVI